MGRPLQTAIWARQAQWMLAQCRSRLGHDLHAPHRLRRHVGGRLATPKHVKEVFTGDPQRLPRRRGQRDPAPVLGAHSVLLLDETPHMRQRKLLLPPFHGERMQRYGELMVEIAAREIERWPLGEPFALHPRMQAITLEVILRAVFGVARGRAARARCARRCGDCSTSRTNPRDDPPGRCSSAPSGSSAVAAVPAAHATASTS